MRNAATRNPTRKKEGVRLRLFTRVVKPYVEFALSKVPL